MAYNVNDVSQKILNLKNLYEDAAKNNNQKLADNYGQQAKTYYDTLKNNGDSAVANNLSQKNYTDAQSYLKNYNIKTNNNAIRPYMYNLGTKYNLSNSDIDKLLSYDNDTGEVTFAGSNLGKPKGISSDGVSYWDSDTLDNAFNSFISSSGTTRPASNLVNQENENLANNWNETYKNNNSDYNDMKNTYLDYAKINPFSTEEAKSIFGRYNIAGQQAMNNAYANGAANNSGSIDSYAAANAARQQASMNSLAEQAALDAYNTKLGVLDKALTSIDSKTANAIDILKNMGINVQQVFDQDQTAKNNQVTRDAATAEVTGVVPKSMQYENNPYFNSDGTLINIDTDYQAIANDVTASLEEEKKKSNPNAQLIANYEKTLSDINEARAYKTRSDVADGKYVQYAPTVIHNADKQTEAGRQYDAGLKNNLDAIETQGNVDIKVGDNDAKNQINVNTNAANDQMNIDSNSAKNQISVDNNTAKNSMLADNNSTSNQIAVLNANSTNAINQDNASASNQVKISRELNSQYDVSNVLAMMQNSDNYNQSSNTIKIGDKSYTASELRTALIDGKISVTQDTNGKYIFN